MKNLTILFIFFSTFGNAQTNSCEYLELAVNYFNKKELDSAIILMVTAVENTPDTVYCYGRCFNNIPLAYAMQGNFEEAERWFKKILDSDLNDLDQGTDIMEFYANYHHNACMKLVQLHQQMNEPREALNYLNLAETTYPFQTFSGTSFEKRAVSIALWKARIYEELSLPDSALFVQLNKILDTDIRYRKPDYESLSNVNPYNDLLENMKTLIGEKNLEDEKKQLIKSIKKMEIVQNGDMRKGTFTYRGLNYEIGISDSSKSDKEIINRLLGNYFFEL